MAEIKYTCLNCGAADFTSEDIYAFDEEHLFTIAYCNKCWRKHKKTFRLIAVQ